MSLEYLAGFFDGEGCITVSKNGSLSLGVVNTSREVLNLFVDEFGGTLSDRKQMVNKKQYVWRAYGDTAVTVLRRLQPYLIEKQNQAVFAMHWMTTARHCFPPSQAQGRGKVAHPNRASAIKDTQTTLTHMKLGIYID